MMAEHKMETLLKLYDAMVKYAEAERDQLRKKVAKLTIENDELELRLWEASQELKELKGNVR